MKDRQRANNAKSVEREKSLIPPISMKNHAHVNAFDAKIERRRLTRKSSEAIKWVNFEAATASAVCAMRAVNLSWCGEFSFF
jgi:hypothetical protein